MLYGIASKKLTLKNIQFLYLIIHAAIRRNLGSSMVLMQKKKKNKYEITMDPPILTLKLLFKTTKWKRDVKHAFFVPKNVHMFFGYNQRCSEKWKNNHFLYPPNFCTLVQICYFRTSNTCLYETCSNSWVWYSDD